MGLKVAASGRFSRPRRIGSRFSFIYNFLKGDSAAQAEYEPTKEF
jgi:hypothetical protein